MICNFRSGLIFVRFGLGNEMSKPTWGLHIPGYSSPSTAQKRAFAKMHPDVVAWHRIDMDQRERDERLQAEEVRRRYRASIAKTTGEAA